MNFTIARLVCLALIFCTQAGYAGATEPENVIRVFCDSELGEVNKKVFGQNLLGYDPQTYESGESGGKPYYGFSDYGSGIWDPAAYVPVKPVIDLAKMAGMTVARFPGGCGSHRYDWKKTIDRKRRHFLFGVDEFLKACEVIGVEPVFTVSYFTGNEQDAADLVKYLNSPNDGSNVGGGIDWALERAKNGHAAPYGVKYFEIGNEVWHGDHRDIKQVRPQDYAVQYLKYYSAMKAVDTSIRIGAVMHTQDWNEKVLKIVKDKLDFGILHVYPTPVWGEELSSYSADEIFRTSLALPVLKYESDLTRLSGLFKTFSGAVIPVAVTEYNAGFVQEKPVPYRFCLGNALVNAELLRIFMKPENNVLMANHWGFVNEYWGMAANGFDGSAATLSGSYYRRPNDYVFDLYHRHFGDVLLRSEVESDSYRFRMRRVPYLSVNASKNDRSSRVYLMVINKRLDKGIPVKIGIVGLKRIDRIHAWVLNADSIDATNERVRDRVGVKEAGPAAGDKDYKNNSFRFTFEPHSLTAIEIQLAP